MKHSGSLLPLLLVAVLAGLTFWLQSVSEPGSSDRSGKSRHDPDFIVERFTVRRFDTGGGLQHTLASSRMEHFPDDDSTVVTEPRITFHRTSPTQLSANSAWVSKDAKEIRLEGNVRLVRSAADSLATVVTTTRLSIFPDDEVARTNTAVTIEQGRSVINGTGLVADNKIQTTTLLGPVRGTIVRKSASGDKAP